MHVGEALLEFSYQSLGGGLFGFFLVDKSLEVGLVERFDKIGGVYYRRLPLWSF